MYIATVVKNKRKWSRKNVKVSESDGIRKSSAVLNSENHLAHHGNKNLLFTFSHKWEVCVCINLYNIYTVALHKHNNIDSEKV